MKIKPILFNADMVRAILDGRKTVTRRIIKPQPKMRLSFRIAGDSFNKWSYPPKTARELWGEEFRHTEDITVDDMKKTWNPPYNADDILYVRESGMIQSMKAFGRKVKMLFSADESLVEFTVSDKEYERLSKWAYLQRFLSPYWLTKETARIWLKVTDVRVERLQEITSEKSVYEGVGDLFYEDIGYSEKDYGCSIDEKYGIAKEQFAWLWDSTIKKADIDLHGWKANPWVWVIEFEWCEKPKEESA